MDDLYDDLTNYEDVNALEELRTENKGLKEMLEKRSASLEKLQKEILQDFDFLEVEFKKLQHNYSSLLMTARSEIKRKTERINQLNTEKDLMVLDALKSGKRIRRNFSGGQTKYELGGKGNNKNKEENVKQKNVDIKKERCEAPVKPPKIVVPEPVTCNRNKSDNAGIKAEPPSTRKSSVNENIAHRKTDLNEPPRTSASSIRDRRKSMPAVSLPVDTFSTDDEVDRNFQAKDTRTDHIQSDNERRNTNKMPIDRYNNQISETSSSVDDRVHNNHDSTSRDYYKGKSSRYPDSNSQRGRDKYDVSLKNRKPYSPERGQKRQYREHHDDNHRYERERYKGRHLESPPRESYNRYQQRKSDHRPEYDRYSRDHEKKYDKYSSSKYRLKDDEPHAKRPRTESNGNPEAKEDKRRYHESEPVDGQPEPRFSPYDDMLRSSCQSPDYTQYTDTDANLAHPIKEILATAATPLEDPRVTSKKYVIWKENGNERLSTAVGMDIDIRPVNKAVWNIKPVDIPVALVRRPSQCSDQLVKDIYMDIGNSETNLDFSLESGEVRETDEEMHENRSKPKELQNNTQDFKLNKHVTKDISKPAPDVLKIPITNMANYRIPKKGLNIINTDIKMDVPIIDLGENVSHHKHVYRKTAEDSSPKELLSHKQQYNEERTNLSDSTNNKKYSQIEHIQKTKSKEPEYHLQKELSMHTHRHYEREKNVNVKDSLPNVQKYNKTESKRKSRSRERFDSIRKESSTHTQQYDEREKIVNVIDSLPNNGKDNKIEDNRKSRSSDRLDSIRKESSTHIEQYDEREEHVNVIDSFPNNRKDNKIEGNRKSRSRERENSSRKILSTNKQQYNEPEEQVKVKITLPDNKKYSQIKGHKKSRSRERENSFKSKLLTQQDQHDEHAHIEDSFSKNKHNSKIEVNKKSRSKERSENQHQATLNKIAIVADDLELSDDNSDHMDTYKRVTPAKLKKNCETTIASAETDGSVNNTDDKTITSSRNTEIERTVDTAEIKDGTEEENFKESDGAKKQKSRKKKYKAKVISKDLVESTADDIHDPEKIPRSKKEKESTRHETKEKFTELFGDSCSLMTPEDLGIPSYLPISEDTQNAVDMKINQIIDANPLIDKYDVPTDIQTQNRVEVNKIQETNAHDGIPNAVLQKSDVDGKEVVTEVIKKSSKKNEENLVEPSQLPSPIVYENLNPGSDLNDPNVVKTVIISTGRQAEIANENKIEVTKPAAPVEVNSMQNTTDLFPPTKEYKIDLLKALATSTPHKEFSALNPLLPDAAKTDIICDPCVSQAVSTITNASQAVNQTETNTSDMNDAPDVRIFVKRRRKVVKRPPMT